MEVVVVQSEVFQNMVTMFQEVCQKLSDKDKELKKLEIELLTPKEVGEMVKLTPATILERKEEIGFTTLGNKVLFYPNDVRAFFDKHKVTPKTRYK